jgi:hypothetical protein
LDSIRVRAMFVGPELDGDAREAGARAEVCEAVVRRFGLWAFGNVSQNLSPQGTQRTTHLREEVASGEEGFAEVAGDDFFLDRGWR